MATRKELLIFGIVVLDDLQWREFTLKGSGVKDTGGNLIINPLISGCRHKVHLVTLSSNSTSVIFFRTTISLSSTVL